jgi:hypothetical protein
MVYHHTALCCNIINMILSIIALCLPLIVTGTCKFSIDAASGKLLTPGNLPSSAFQACHIQNFGTNANAFNLGLSPEMAAMLMPGGFSVKYDVGIWGTCWQGNYQTIWNYQQSTETDWNCDTWDSDNFQYIVTYKHTNVQGYDLYSTAQSSVEVIQALYTTAVCFCVLGVCSAAGAYASASNGSSGAIVNNFLAGTFFLSVACYMASSIHSNDILGWNYTFIYAWIAWFSCWSAIYPSLKHREALDEAPAGDDAHADAGKV